VSLAPSKPIEKPHGDRGLTKCENAACVELPTAAAAMQWLPGSASAPATATGWTPRRSGSLVANLADAPSLFDTAPDHAITVSPRQ